jgi:carboxymethylenebutenolidase
MGTMTVFSRPDGQLAPAYLAEPLAPSSLGIVVLQEWWGLSPFIKRVADRLAEVGYQALAPDLYRGRLTTEKAEAESLMSELNWGDAVTQDIQGSISYLNKTHPKVGVIGFCMGGALSLLAAAQASDLNAAVCYYGIPAADLSQIRIPIQAHFANHDDWCHADLIQTLETTLQTSHVSYDLYRYEAQHAFMNEDRPEVYAPEVAQLAWDRTLVFLGHQASL